MDQEKQDSNWMHADMHLFREMAHAHRELVGMFSREVGVTPARLKLYHELMHTERGGVSLGDLANRLGVTPALVTRQVKELENEGLVRRRQDTRDGRKIFIQLSTKGVIEVFRVHERGHLFESAMLDYLDPEDVVAAMRVLSTLTEKLKSWRQSGRYMLESAETKDAE